MLNYWSEDLMGGACYKVHSAYISAPINKLILRECSFIGPKILASQVYNLNVRKTQDRQRIRVMTGFDSNIVQKAK